VVQAAIAWLGHHKSVGPAEETARASSEVVLYVQSKLRNAEVIESMGMIESLRQRWRRQHDAALGRSGDWHARSGRISAISKFVRYSQQSLSLGAGALLVIDGQMSPGAMIASNLLINRALGPIDQLVSVWRSFISTRAAFARLEQLLTEFPERDANLTRVAPKGELTLRNVFATAPGRQTPILKAISFSVSPSTVVGVVGPSGSGKSTLARVMTGIWPDVAGEVLIDGLPIQGWDRTELGPHLGYLPQDIELFEGTIAENIARFSEVDSAKVIEAARTTGLHEMILRYPKGYDTPVGEAGRLLSGGQRQRIGLARAVYGNPSLIVLDEPNANLDEAGETALRQTVLQLKALGKSVILITHRPAILSVVDQLLVLQNGELKAHGPRDAVLNALRLAAQPSSPPPSSNLAGQPA
jgi:ATP-binding cassette subfamily C exporter for protease/lipase